MGRRRYRKGANQVDQIFPKDQSSNNQNNVLLPGVTPVKTVCSVDIELALYNKIDAIRCRFLNSNFSNLRTLACDYPSFPSCPRYRRQPRGLLNTRRCCYFSTCLQTLFSLSPFVAILHDLFVAVHPLFAETSYLRNSWMESQAESIPLIRLLLLHLEERTPYKLNESQSGESIFSNDSGYFYIGKPLSLDPKFFTLLNFEIGYEHDAADCMTRLITKLHEEMAALIRKFGQPKDNANNTENSSIDGDDGWTTVATKGKKIREARHAQVDNGEVTPISLLFGGTLVSSSSYQKVSRLTEKSTLDMKERFFVLPLELRNPQVRCVEDAFQFLSKSEVLSDFRDPETGLCVVVNRRTLISRLPPVLFVQLNRFHYSSESGGIQKVLKQIPIHRHLQITGSIVSKERTFSKAQGHYELKSVVFHIGYTAERGHYTVGTIVQDDEALYYDDSTVCRLNLNKETWTDVFASHRPFDTRNARCRPQPCPPLTSLDPKQPPNIMEQPRTPYLLVYVSCFGRQ